MSDADEIAPACPYCTGSHWLMDSPGMGPCVCLTPEALQAAERALEDEINQREEAADYLTAYLVSLGHDAAPTRLDDRNLMAVVNIVIYAEPPLA